MTRLIFALLFVALVAGPCGAQDAYPRSDLAGLYLGGMLGVVDISRSAYEIGAKRAVEVNPFLVSLSNKPELFAALKATADSAVIYSLYRMHPKNPKAVRVATWMYVAIRAVIVVHNYRTAVLARR